MNNLTLIETLKQKDLTKYDNLNILFQMCLNILETDTDLAIKTCKFVKNKAAIQAGNIKFFELYNQCLLMLAPYCFDEYLLYLEKDREPQKRFYLPRRKTLKMVVDDLQELQDRKIDFLGVSLPPRVGKALSDDTPVLTSKGWINHGDLMVGDVVINDRGQFVKVLQVHPKCQMEYRVTFTDGTHIDCHGNHEWKVYNKHRTKYEILETKSMISGIEYGDERIRGHRYMYQMPITDFVIGKKKSLKVQPYTLGVWLGDGRNNNPDICGDKRDTEEELKGILEEDYVVAWHTTHKTTEVEYYGIYGLRKGLQAYGMCHSRQRTDKNIPNEYFTASIEQRLKLLAGLIDTDGCLRRKEQRYDFTTAEPRLRDDFISLISTFGWRASVKQCEPKMSSGGIQGRHTYWVISFNPTCYIPCRLERKQLHTFSQPRRIAIQSIQPISGVQGNCITVEGGLYLAGKTLKITHNSTLCIFFMTWQMGKYPNMANLMSGHSDKLTKGFFSEALNIIKNPEYLWKDVFPKCKIERTNADDEIINLNDYSRFTTLTCRSVGGTLTGAVEAANLLYSDDLIEDREESLNPLRLENKYQAYLNQLLDRKKDGCKELMVGTRWNVSDPLGRIEAQYKDNPRYRFRKIPALNEYGESNFVYEYGLGFSTQYYIDIQDKLDKNEWMAKYQQAPFVREGLLFPSDELNYYNGTLPGVEPDRILFAGDVAWGGGDSLSQPFCYQFGEDGYIHDVVFNRGDKTVTRPIVVGKIIQHKAQMGRYEANNGGDEYADNVNEDLLALGYHCNISHRKAPSNQAKMSRIIQYAPEIKKFYYIDDKHASPEYRKFMAELTTTVQTGANEHDDAADSMAQLVAFMENGGGFVKIFKRPC